jgi:hypothetical protein
MISTQDASGIHFTFDNKFILSIQYGYGNYCENRSVDQTLDKPVDYLSLNHKPHKSINAEIAILHQDKDIKFYENNDMMTFGRVANGLDDEVAGWIPTEKIMDVMEWVRRLPTTYRHTCDILDFPIKGRIVEDDYRNILWYPKPWNNELIFKAITQSEDAIHYIESPSIDIQNYYKLKWIV